MSSAPYAGHIQTGVSVLLGVSLSMVTVHVHLQLSAQLPLSFANPTLRRPPSQMV